MNKVPVEEQPPIISKTISELPEDDIVTLVTGLPRSGTSMMMQMLLAGGCPVLMDNLRVADVNNPNGYLEYDPVKYLHAKADWLPLARGKALKVIAPLLPFLPLKAADGSLIRYHAVFMKRDWCEIADSQKRMLCNCGLEHLAQPEHLLRQAMKQDINAAYQWLHQHAVPSIDVDYRETLANLNNTTARIAELIPRFSPSLLALQYHPRLEPEPLIIEPTSPPQTPAAAKPHN